jgi:hypothetical protein
MKGKYYRGHELALMFKMKVLEGKSVTKFVNNRFKHSS